MRCIRNSLILRYPRRPFRHDLLGRRVGLLARGSRLRGEGGAAVVVELADRLEDVGEGTVPAVLRGGLEVDPGEPAARQLLDARDVDAAVVQVRVDAGHVLREEGAVGSDRTARERCRTD